MCFILLAIPLLLSAQRRDKLDRANREFTTGDYPGAIRTLQSIKGIEGDAESSLLLSVSQFHANDLLSAESGLLALAERNRLVEHGKRARRPGTHGVDYRSEGATGAFRLALRIEHNVEALASGHRKAAHHHRQHEA